MKEWTRVKQQFLDRLGVMSYQFDGELNQKLVSLARQENCSPNEVAAKLLQFALNEHRKVQHQNSHWRLLSAREKETATYICQGLTNAEIALKLGISPETVKTHVHNVLTKFSLRNKHELQMALEGCDFNMRVYAR